MDILGLSYMYHDSAATLCRDGRIIAAVAEERFLRQKHTVEFPTKAIAFCLAQAGHAINETDYIVFYEKPFLKFERILTTHLITYPFSFPSFRKFIPLWLSYKLYVPQLIRDYTGYTGKILFCDHHYAHAASAFLVSPFERAAVLTIDGTGEWSTLAYGIGEGTTLSLEKTIYFPHSLGMLYSAVTAHLGFKVNWAEGTVMGLAAYGEPCYKKQFDRLIIVKPDGSFQLDLSYFAFHYNTVMTNKRFSRLLFPPRAPDEPITQAHRDLAATLQYFLEDVIVKLARHVHSRYRTDRLCIAGGVGLNCSVNGKILEKTPFREIFIQPAAGDDGGALGAALYTYTHLLRGNKRWPMTNGYLGPDYSQGDIEDILRSRRIMYNTLDTDMLLQSTAEAIYHNKIVGWFQGRMEFGPRALGNRSILANPCNPAIKDMLNQRVKKREPFRPYAPVVCAEDRSEYFLLPQESPFMNIAASVKPEKRERIPGVVHCDGSARVQTVTPEQNPLVYQLLRRFQRLTGVPVLLNTSFNMHGEPIVCSPLDALHTFFLTDMDMLVIGNCVIDKANQKNA